MAPAMAGFKKTKVIQSFQLKKNSEILRKEKQS